MAEASAAADAPAPAHHRRQVLVDRGFQLKYALLMAGAGLVVAVVFGLWLHQAHAQATALLAPDPQTRALVARSDRVLLGAFAAIALLLAGALGLLGIVVTHRVAGPVFVMGHYLRVLSQGRFPRMRTLRRSDELKPFFRTFIDAVETMKLREARHAAVLEDALERMRAVSARSPELVPAIEALTLAARERRSALALDDPEPTPLAVPAPMRRAAP
ncbi:MAG TPA: hypothetical protein VLC54_12150 [Anaeromyxobacter sp.]|nr:hypothetical protein [Anaeromyxobacter sp.]